MKTGTIAGNKQLATASQYCNARNFTGSYRMDWIRRFQKREEWNLSDYEGRRILQQSRPEHYPKDLDATI